MGLSIHYSGRFRNPASILEMIEEDKKLTNEFYEIRKEQEAVQTKANL